jgi:hypothetical protein
VSANLLTITGTAAFPGHVVKPDTHFPANPAFTLALEVPFNGSYTQIIRAINSVTVAQFGSRVQRSIQMPFEATERRFQVRFRTKDRPKLLDASGRQIPSGIEIELNEEVTVVAQIDPWTFNGSQGVSLRMLSVQRLAEPRAVAASSARPPADQIQPAAAGSASATDPFAFAPEDAA